LRFERQLASQCGTKFRPGSRFTDNKGARGTHVHDVKAAKLLREDARAKRSVSANIHAPKKDYKRHAPDYAEKT